MSKKRSITDDHHHHHQLNISMDDQINLKKLKSTSISTDTDLLLLNHGGGEDESLFARLDDNLLYEIFKHADARTLASFSCVSKIWNRTAQDERLWEMICTRRWSDVNHSGGEKQLRSVVLALGGFRRLYSLYLSKTAAPSAGRSAAASPPLPRAAGSKRWGKDEVNLSLSLLSIQFYEKMSSSSSSRGK